MLPLTRKQTDTQLRKQRPGKNYSFDYKRSQCFQILQIRSRIVIRRLKNECRVREFRMLSKTLERFTPDMAFTNVPVPIHARIVLGARVIEMNGTHVSQTDGAANDFNCRFQAFFFANVVTSGK